LADGKLIGRDTVDSQGQSRRVDVLVDRLEEVGGLEITREREGVTEENAEEVAFRRHVVRRSHGRRDWGLGAWVPKVKVLCGGCGLGRTLGSAEQGEAF
jgi:hypothetical protein